MKAAGDAGWEEEREQMAVGEKSEGRRDEAGLDVMCGGPLRSEQGKGLAAGSGRRRPACRAVRRASARWAIAFGLGR